MFSEKDYTVVCHGCGKFHIVRSAFMSMPMSIGIDGWAIPAYGCPECRATPGVIAHAWKHGMSQEARANAENQFRNEWRAKLEAKR